MVSPIRTLLLTLTPTITTIFTEITETTEIMRIFIMAYTKAGEQVEWVMHQGGVLPNLHFLSNFDFIIQFRSP